MSNDVGNILNCLSCYKSTCKLCGEESHIPLRCNEVEKKCNEFILYIFLKIKIFCLC